MTPRLLLACALVTLTFAATGCNVWRARQAAQAARDAEQQARDEAQPAAQQAKQAEEEQNKAVEETDKPESDSNADRGATASRFTHLVSVETAYYKTGPQQGRPPDGKIKAGTKVFLVREAGSYTLIRSEDGLEAFVAAEALQPLGEAAPMNIGPLVEGNTRFALDLYDRLRSGKGNLFFSPTSISTALAMAYAGASGGTEAEMAKTLHFPMPQEQLHDAMSALQSSWKTSDKKKGFHLQLANRLWGKEGYEFRPAFLELTRTKYGAALARLDFAQKTEEARRTINQWVERQTEDKIKDLIPSPQLLADARLVLTNAVYFKGDWSAPFDKNRTKDEDFHLSATEKVKAPLMHRQGEFRYASTAGLQILDLRYGDGSLSMVVLLPEKMDGLADLEGKLTLANLHKWIAGCRSQQVVVSLPRFKTTAQFEMSDTLKSMGMASAFNPSTADFSGMTSNKNLFISAVIHKAFVDVNEEGTEAAAATGIIMTPTSAVVEPKKPPVFRADHPFIFLIRDNRNGSILFLGRVADPR